MQTIGFVISQKENEKRRALLPVDLNNIRNKSFIFIEKGYGDILGISDQDYIKTGVNIASRDDVYKKDIICSPKAPEPHETKLFGKEQTLFGWIHAVQGRRITDFLINKRMTGIAWEDMYCGGRHVFWRNNEIAGEAGVLHALSMLGKFPRECKVAVLGKGNTAKGAISILEKLGAEIVVYDRKTIALLQSELGYYDIIVNCVLWDVFREDRLIHKADLLRMKKDAMIIDISCNHNMEIETSTPTSIEDPVYRVNNIAHYVVDHTASLFWKTASYSISSAIKLYIDDLIEGRDCDVLKKATVIKNGSIVDRNICRFQKRD